MLDIKKRIAKPSIEYRNDVRWWLAEALHTDETLKNDIRMLDEAGFGAAEFLAMDEFGADSRMYGWGSEEFVHDTHVIIDETTKRGMGASMTSGTNWSNANLITIVPDDKAAAKELTYVAETLKAGERYSKKLPRDIKLRPNVHEILLIAVVASKILGETDGKKILDKNGIVLTDSVKDEFLNWTAPEDGDYELFTIWMHGTGQTASPSCAVSYTINYIDSYGTEALIDYWNRVVLTPELRANIIKNNRVQLYMDSLELTTYANGGQFWGYNFLAEFKTRRGYDLTPYLPLIFKKSAMMVLANAEYRYLCDDGDFFFKLKNDLYQTMTDMYMENVLKPIQSWLHSVSMTLRAEISYGLPFEISQPGKYVDGIETESLEFSCQIDSYRGLAGAAHVYNRLYSSETGALLANYKKTIEFYTQMIYTQFAAGVARTVLHGYSSICGSEKATQWPGHEGMWPIFSERFGMRQPAFRHYNDWNDMISRYQYILRQGNPRMDIAILRLDYAYNKQLMMFGKTEDETYGSSLMRANVGIYWKNTDLQNAGYTYDYLAPQLLDDMDYSDTACPDGPAYQAIIVYQDSLPIEAAKRLLLMAKKGVKVLFVNNVTETTAPFYDVYHKKAASRTPFNDGKDLELLSVIEEIKALENVSEVDSDTDALPELKKLGVEPRIRFTNPNRNVLPFMREEDGARYVFMYNCMYNETEPVTFDVEILGNGVPYEIDCWSGDVNSISDFRHVGGRTVFSVTLKPGEADMFCLDLTETGIETSTDASFIIERDGKKFAYADASGEYTVNIGGTEKKLSIAAPDDIDIPEWNLKVEDWNEGEKKIIEEDRGLGYVSREVYFETKKTVLNAGKTDLKPWKDIPEVGEDVSGVGFYTAEFTLPDDYDANNIAKLTIGSVNGQTARAFINGVQAKGIDFDNPEVDISSLVKAGVNSILVEVSSTLTNRLRQRGYFAGIPARFAMLMSESPSLQEMEAPADNGGQKPEMGDMFGMLTMCDVRDYGMTGFAKIKTYGYTEI